MSAVELSERELCAALRRGDEAAFADLVVLYHAPLRRLALTYVRSAAVADEVVQETWLAVVRGIQRFEERSSLKTWIFRILSNTAKTRAEREARTVPLSAFGPGELDADEPPVDPSRFLDQQHARWPGHWASPPTRWDTLPAERLEGNELLGALKDAIDELPSRQRQVIVLRDIEGWGAEEVCKVLELSEANQRVLLHRARSKVRQAVEEQLGELG
jgi:RNA polymerase sigma-70 factor (ECF subfamily)